MPLSLLPSSVTLLARARNHMRPPAEYNRLMIGLEPERLVIEFQARDIDKRARPDLAGHDLAVSDQPGDGPLRYRQTLGGFTGREGKWFDGRSYSGHGMALLFGVPIGPVGNRSIPAVGPVVEGATISGSAVER